MHPSMLEEDEKHVLLKSFGEDWYVKWGYVKGDLNEIITINR
jgi:hypothetical protein